MKNFLTNIIENYRKAIPVIYALFFSIVSIRIVEYITYNSNSIEKGIKISYLNGGILLDFVFSNFIVFILLLIQSVFFSRVIKKRYFLIFFSIIIIIITAILSQIFLETTELLDEIFYQFSLDDLIKISGGKEGIDIKTISLFSMFLVIFLGIYFVLRRIIFGEKTTYIFVVFTILSVAFSSFLNYKSEKHIAFKLVNNKLVYFSLKSFQYFTSSEIEYTDLNELDRELLAGEPIDEEYPLMHTFEPDRNFASLFKKKDNTPPNLVFIIVESLSTDFVGKYADSTGHIMPFLDSLSKKSLYFPNIISTAERTYNVLPAVLSSTPNAPKHERFMMLELPRHWSIFDILREKYFSRFYCGVYLEFDGMINYLKYHETDYIVNKWEKQFSTNFSPKNQWGFPDHQLFDKSIVDLNKQHQKLKKSRLDVFLTISTHHPYVIPNQEVLTKELNRDLQHNLKPSPFRKIALRRCKELSVYRYTDNSLRDFFNKMKKRSDYDNTIFFILGDHGSGLHIRNDLSRATTPVLIYSKLLKKPKEYKALSSHLDILPSVLSLLNTNYLIDIPKVVPFMGKGLRLNNNNTLIQPISSFSLYNQFMVYKDYYLFHDQLYKIKENLNIVPVDNSKMKSELKEKMINYDKLCSYTIYKDKLIPIKDFDKYFNSSTFKLLKSVRLKNINTRDIYINFNNYYKLDSLDQQFKFEFHFKYYIKSLKDLESIPKLVVSYSQKSKLINWVQFDARINQSFKGKGWYKMKYVYTSDIKELRRLKNYDLTYYILNSEQKKYEAKDIFIYTYLKR